MRGVPSRSRQQCTAAAVAVRGSCSSDGADAGKDTAAGDPGTGHLHGLGVDPADGTVYAAGHLGLFRFSDGKALCVADRAQDLMGFTITGPSVFLSSGHPSPAGAPPPTRLTSVWPAAPMRDAPSSPSPARPGWPPSTPPSRAVCLPWPWTAVFSPAATVSGGPGTAGFPARAAPPCSPR